MPREASPLSPRKRPSDDAFFQTAADWRRPHPRDRTNRSGRGILRRRVVDPELVCDDPLAWPESEAIAAGSKLAWDSGDANATVIGDRHYVAFYSGKAPDTSVVLSEHPVPKGGE